MREPKEPKYVYITDEGRALITAHDHCMMCDRCTDTFIDWDGIPYMFICEDDHDTDCRDCPHFKFAEDDPRCFRYEDWMSLSEEEQKAICKKYKKILSMAEIMECMRAFKEDK